MFKWHFVRFMSFLTLSSIKALMKPIVWARAVPLCPAKLQSNVWCQFQTAAAGSFGCFEVPLWVRATAWQIESVTLNSTLVIAWLQLG